MKLTIIPSDGFIAENGISYSQLSWVGTPPNVHALQWDSSTPINRVLKSVVEELVNEELVPITMESISTYYGWIEFNDGTPNEDISVLPSWTDNALEAWTQANNPPPPPPPEPPTAEENKMTAIGLLQETDFAEYPSVSDISKIPHLANAAEFISYRDQVRVIAVTPIAGDLTWPTKPQEVWVTA